MDRRNFIALGASAAVVLAASVTAVSGDPATPKGRSVADFGVTPNSDGDQTAAFQRAIDEITGSGQPVFVPPGRYAISLLTLPATATLIGIPDHSIFVRRDGSTPMLFASAAKAIRLSALTLDGAATPAANAPSLISISGGTAVIEGLTFTNTAKDALLLTAVAPEIFACRFERCAGTAIKLRQSNAAIITDSIIENTGIGIDYDARAGAGVTIISGNRVRKVAQNGIVVSGSATISSNVIEDAGEFGLRIGGPITLGTFSAVNNMIRNANIGIGVSNADGGYGVITLNMITGARGGGIRALNDGKVTGPDLAKSSAEAFRNLAIAGNVSV